MPKNKMLAVLLCGVLLVAAPAEAVNRNSKDLNRVTVWNKVTDYFATVGRNSKDKQKIVRQRKISRRTERLGKARAKAQKEQRKRANGYKASYFTN